MRPVVLSKVSPTPIPAGLLVRERLVARLHSDARVHLVAAMPGFGKTVLVRHWADSLDVPVAWVALDLLDEDASSFWTHVVAAVGSAVPGVDDESAQLLAERGTDDWVFLAALIAALEHSATKAVLVLDGLPAHVERGVLDGLAVLVERAGHLLRIVVTTRANPALPLGRWRTLSWLDEIREDELALVDTEAVEIARRSTWSSTSPSEAVDLNRRVAGWPLGFHMSLLARRTGGTTVVRDMGRLESPIVPGYLVADVLSALSDRERRVVMSLSVLEWFDPEMCEAMLGGEVDVVHDLLAGGLFLTVVDARTGAMRFHPLFRELMEHELAAREPHRRVELHRRASVIWRDRGDLMAAYRHLSAIGETEQAHDLIVGPAWALVDAGDLPGLRRFARRLPTARNIDDAELALDLALVALYSEGTVAARRWCDRAEVLVERATAAIPTVTPPHGGADDHVTRLRELGCVVALFDADLDTGLDCLAAHPGPLAGTGTGLFDQRFPIFAARTMLAARNFDAAESWIRVAERNGGHGIVASVAVPTLRAWHDWFLGDLARALARLDAALAWMDAHGVAAHHHGFDTLISASWCQLAAGRLPEAVRLAQRAREDAAVLDSAWCHLQAGYLSAQLAVVMGDPHGALRRCDDLRARIDFASCWPYAQRILAVEIEALAMLDRHDEVRRLIATLEPGPRRQLLVARLANDDGVDVEAILDGRQSWPANERLQAAIVVAAVGDGDDLVSIIAECARSGWVLPLLEVRALIEDRLPARTLVRLHPQFGSALAFAGETDRSEPATELRLTERELTLVRLLPTHLTYAAMGEHLFLSVNTVKLNLKSVYRKLGASTRDEAVRAARTAGLLDPASGS